MIVGPQPTTAPPRNRRSLAVSQDADEAPEATPHDDAREAVSRTAYDRDRTAEDRDQRADAADQVSDGRDRRADARDERAAARELTARRDDPGAAADRAGAWRDRKGAASDREQSADDRHAASIDRHLSARDRFAFAFDDLTGAYRRDDGLVALDREIGKAFRLGQPLVVAFVDVDGLKVINDTEGHGAGDARLRAVADAIRSQLRSYDLVIRYGGDEFLCALSDVTVEDVQDRFVLVNAELAAAHQVSVSVGVTALEDGDDLDGFVSRADQAMYAQRERRSEDR